MVKNTKVEENNDSKERRLEGSPREGLIHKRVLGGRAESEAGPFNVVIPRRITCRDIGKYVLYRQGFL